MLSFPYVRRAGIRMVLLCSPLVFFSCNKETETLAQSESALEQVQKTEALAATSISATGVSYNYLARNAAELQNALKYAKAGQVIYIPSNVNIDVTNERILYLNAGVTITSDRGLKTSTGALSTGGSIFIKNAGHPPRISVKGNDVKVLRIRILGPDTLEQKALVNSLNSQGRLGELKASRGIDCAYSNLTIDNSEFAGWTHAAIYFTPGAKKGRVTNNYIHHNRRWLTGYGVNFNGGEGLVAYNIFDKNRHAIAGWGVPGTSYEAAYNTVISSTSHGFDMHGGVNRGDGTNIAGTRVYIHHNTFYNTGQRAIFINGVTQELMSFQYNKCVQSNDPKTGVYYYPAPNAYNRYNTFNIVKKPVAVALKSY